ncbi:MAG TPA: MarR family transcriptional regulator [Eoetvoesiella sp.]
MTQPSIFFLSQQVFQAVRRRLEIALQAENLTPTQYMVLSLIRTDATSSSAVLARQTNITPQSMGELIKALELKGLVSRSDDVDNRRVALLQHTPAGKRKLTRCIKLAATAEEDFLDGLSTSEAEQLRELLRRIRQREFGSQGEQLTIAR